MWEGADFNRTFAGDAGTTQFTVVDLRPFTEHTLRLFVSNAVMLEGESAEVVGTTVSLSKCYNCPGWEEGEPGVKRSACTAAGGFE